MVYLSVFFLKTKFMYIFVLINSLIKFIKSLMQAANESPECMGKYLIKFVGNTNFEKLRLTK